MSSIYRKYRPQTFAEMVGQNHIKLTVENELMDGSFTHAYLFAGPRGLGKTTAARLFAKAVNCENRKAGASEPCNKCQSCAEITQGKSLDVMEIDAASHTGVDNVRENIIENARFSPHKAQHKVFIIDEVHMLSLSAFNALLKTLEEPPARTIFILCTTEIHKVPETIISRCQRFDFKKVGAGEAIKRLRRIADEEETKIDDEVFELIARKSEGCMRDAETLLGQVLSLGGKKITKEQVALVLPSSETALLIDFLKILLAKQSSEGVNFINKISEEGVDLEVFDGELVEFLRKLILVKLNAVKSEWLGLSEELTKEALELVELNSINRLVETIKAFMAAGQELKNSQIAQLPMELAIVKLCEDSAAATVAMPFSRPAINKYQISDNKEDKADDIKEMRPIKKEEIRNQKLEIKNQELGTRNQKSEIVEQGALTENLVIENINNEKNESGLKIFKDSWPKIILASHKKSTDLMFINEKMVWPLSFCSGVLTVGFKYDLHKCRFESNSNRQIFAEVIATTTGEQVNIEAKTLKPSEIVDLEIEMENKANSETKMSGIKVTEDNILTQILDSFGGEVVDQ